MKWIISWVLVLFQLGALGFFSDSNSGLTEQVLLLACALVGAILATRQKLEIGAGRAVLLSLVALAFFLCVPWPYSAGGVILAAGLALSAGGGSLIERVGCATTQVGRALLYGAALAALYAWFGPLWHELPLLTPLMGGLLELLGFAGANADGRWIAPGTESVLRFTPTIEGFGLLPLLLLLSGRIAMGGSWKGLRPSCYALLLGLVLVYLPLRYALVFAWVDSTQQFGLLIDPWPMALSFLPLALLLARFDLLGERKVIVPAEPATHGWLSFATAALACCAFWVLLLDPDPGVQKLGRVCIDESKSEWERTDVPMDTETYGQHTTYNYSGLAAYLAQHYELSLAKEGITDSVLENCDVLILKMPTMPYSVDEIARIHAFVDGGGGLFMIGDHTNLFGSSEYLNAVADEYEIEFVADATYAYDGGLSLFEPEKVARHPSLTHLPPFLFATSCSLTGGLGVVPVQTGRAMQTMPADYGRRSFFADTEDWSLHRPFGMFHQTLAARAGLGRVIAFSDSTVWSNFFMHVRGKPELLLGLVDWCNRENAVPQLRTWAGGLALALLLASLGLLGRSLRSMSFGDVFLMPAMLGTAIALPSLRAWNEHHYRPVEPRVNIPQVHFIHEGADFFLPAQQLTSDESPSYLNFFNWTQRVGLVPVLSPSLKEALKSDNEDVLVLLRNRRLLSDEDVGLIAARIEAGGRVLVLEDSDGFEHVGPLLERFGVRWNTAEHVHEPHESHEHGDADAFSPIVLAAAFSKPEPSALYYQTHDGESTLHELHGLLEEDRETQLEGGSKWLATEDGSCLGTLNVFPAGGRLLVLGIADLFSTDHMGNSNVVPTSAQREIFELEYEIWRTLLPGVAQ